jgi:hypothetical protein
VGVDGGGCSFGQYKHFSPTWGITMKPRKPAPAPVTATRSLAWPGALLLAAGDARRVRVVDEHTAYTVNSPAVAGPPWPARNGRKAGRS